MFQKAKFNDRALADIIARPGCVDGLRMGGVFEAVCIGPDGAEKWREVAHNLVTTEGIAHILNALLHSSTQITTWYVVPFESDHTPAAGNTYATPGYTECVSYDEAARQAYNEAEASGGSVTNSANKATFTISATKTIYGAALVGGGTDADTKGDAAGGGTLLCLARFASSRSVADDDTLQITYTFSAADDGA